MRGYFDESGTHDQSRVTTIAGWIATTDMWRKGLIKWQDSLASRNLPIFHASEFDYFTRQNQWSSDDYSSFIEILTTILRKYTWLGLSGSVVTSAYNDLPEWLKTKIGGRYHFCFQLVMNQLMKAMGNIISKTPVPLVFERKDDIIDRSDLGGIQQRLRKLRFF
jgi:hypothetical protein